MDSWDSSRNVSCDRNVSCSSPCDTQLPVVSWMSAQTGNDCGEVAQAWRVYLCPSKWLSQLRSPPQALPSLWGHHFPWQQGNPGVWRCSHAKLAVPGYP